jgi:hypothetical protein
MRCGDGLRKVAARAGAGVGQARCEELVECGAVEGQPVRLADLGVPGEAQPVQVFAHRGGELRPYARSVEVLVAQVEQAVGCAGALMRDPEGTRVAEVQQACRRWGEAAGGGHTSSFQAAAGRL